jgi:putative tricarboxylic transport membrane protein
MNADRLGSLFWLALGAGTMYGSLGLGLGSMQEPGSGFLAFTAGCFVSLAALFVFFQSFFGDPALQTKLSSLWEGLKWSRAAIVVVITLAYIVALERLGFFLTSFLLLVSILKGLEKLSWKKTMIISIVTIVVSYCLFKVLLKVSLPVGIFGF